MTRRYYRVVSGTMRALVWANNYMSALRKARKFRNWSELGLLTKFQWKTKNGKWSPWYYVKTQNCVGQDKCKATYAAQLWR